LIYVPKLKNDNITITTNNLRNISKIAEFKVLQYIINEKSDELDKYIKDISKKMNIRITIIDNDGNVLSDSNENPKFMDNHIDRDEIVQAIDKKFGFAVRYSNTLKKKMLYIAKSITYDNKTVAFFRISSFIDDIDKIIFNYVLNIIIFSLLITFFSVASILMIYFNLKKNVLKFSELSKKVAEGDFEVKFNIEDNFESRILAKSFNNMMLKLNDIFNELSSEKEELNSIIDNINDGIAVLDKNGVILRVNNSFKKIVSNDSPEKKYYWEIIRDSNFEKLINRVNAKNKFENSEINIKNESFFLSVNYISLKNEIVLVFYDITEIKEFEKIKKEFVTNVSHELNTPLTSIKGYIETIIEEDNIESIKKYLTIISKNTDRLINIVKDILMLSSLDEKKVLLIDNVDLKVLIENIISIFNQKLKDKNLALNFKFLNETPIIKGDSFKLEQLFINLLDNSIKYTEEGSISLNITRNQSEVVVEIEDTGIGIPEGDIKKIFDRFFVVDKSRSRETGGTGLGLAIVKNIVMLHNGKIFVQSRVGEGTKFSVHFPIYQNL